MSSSTSDSDSVFSPRGLLKLALTALAGGCLALGIWSILVFIQIGAPSEPARWSHETRTIKENAARAIHVPKVLIVGGSGANFGLSAEIISKSLGVPAVNLGVHAGLMLDNLLFHVKPLTSPGDVLLLSLEYPIYQDESLDWNYVDYVFSHDPEYLSSLNLVQKLRLYLSISPARLATGLIHTLIPPERNLSGYQAESIRADNGDETRNSKVKMTKEDWEKNRNQSEVDFFKQPFEVSASVEKQLKEFAHWCWTRSIRAYVLFSPTLYKPGNNEILRKNSDHLLAALSRAGLVTVGRPEDFRYENGYLYDTAWHMNDEGRKKHTEYIMRLLKVR